MTNETSKRRVDLFTMRVSAEERARLERAAKQGGRGVAAFIRDAVDAECKRRHVAAVFTKGAG
jgi:predicted DNA-binding protein